MKLKGKKKTEKLTLRVYERRKAGFYVLSGVGSPKVEKKENEKMDWVGRGGAVGGHVDQRERGLKEQIYDWTSEAEEEKEEEERRMEAKKGSCVIWRFP